MKSSVLAITIMSLQLFSASAIADESLFTQAVTELKDGRVDDGYARLERIAPSDPDFVPALAELQKIHYRRQDWQRFFGYAVYYRKKALDRPEAFNQRLIALEVLALAKHCLWSQAQAIGDGALAYAKAHGLTSTSEIEDTMSHLHLTSEFPKAISAAETTARPAPVFSSSLFWRVGSDELRLVDHPRNLRMLVASRCPR